MPTSITNILSVKAVLISTSVLSASIVLTATDISIYAPSIYNGVVSWLQPPYLYLLINCIILTIVASSKLQSTTDDEPPSPPPPLNTTPVVHRQPEVIPIDFLTPTTTEYKYEGVESNLEIEELDSRRISCDSEDSNSPSIVINGGDADGVDDDVTSNKENECVVIAQSVWTAAENIDSSKFVKPPASARFSHRRNGKASPEGGRTVLGVSKPKKQDTLENTWKTITEGRAIPISRHLKKSDTWDRERHSHQEQENTPPPLKTMRKAETFNERSSTTNGGSGKVRKEPSLSQDELNRRVEAFIKKFNEDMRLQRQESLNQYTEMVNRGGAH